MNPQFMVFIETLTGEVLKVFTCSKSYQETLEIASIEADRIPDDNIRIWINPVNSLVSA
jgi:hypothetical protein